MWGVGLRADESEKAHVFRTYKMDFHKSISKKDNSTKF